MKRRTGHIFKRNSHFYCRWVVNNKVFVRVLKNERDEPVTTEREAETAREKLMATYRVSDETTSLETIAARLEGRKAEIVQVEEQKNPPMPVSNAWAAFEASPERPDSGPLTLREYKSHLAQFTGWIAKAYPAIVVLRDVTADHAIAYATHLQKRGLSPNRFNKHVNFLSLLFKTLKRQAKLGADPWADIKRKRLTTQSRRELTVEELGRLITSVTGEMRVLLALGIYTGLRLGDCATLRWVEVDMVRGFIRRIPNKIARRNAHPVTIPIHTALRAILVGQPRRAKVEYVLPETADLYLNHPDTLTDRVQELFANCDIRTARPGTGVETITGLDGKSTQRKTGKRAVTEVGFHSLRHTFVSLCRGSNAPLSVVESIVGHSNPAMTRHYTHTSEAAATLAVNALPTISTDSSSTVPALPPVVPPPETPIAPDWVVEKLATMTAKNWEKVRDEIVKQGRTKEP